MKDFYQWAFLLSLNKKENMMDFFLPWPELDNQCAL